MGTTRLGLFLVLLLTVFFHGCTSPDAAVTEVPRPHKPWVFRSVIDAQPRMITFALHDDLWVAYHTDDPRLYRAWNGGVNFDGAVYTTVHGPQPSTVGDIWTDGQPANGWSLKINGQSIPLTAKYRGHALQGTAQGHLNYTLTSADGKHQISVEETPDFAEADGRFGLRRSFHFENLPKGGTLKLASEIASVALESSIDTDADWSTASKETIKNDGLEGFRYAGTLAFAKADHVLTTWFTKTPMLDNENKIEGEDGETTEEFPMGYRLIARSDCKSCHNTYVNTVGPSYVDVAKKYPNTEQSIEYLINKIRKGGSGVWGQSAMSAHPELDDFDARAMVEYILGLDTEEALAGEGGATKTDLPVYEASAKVAPDELFSGAICKIYQYDRTLRKLADLTPFPKVLYQGITPDIYLESPDFKGLEENFAFIYEGYLMIPEDNNYVLRLQSDDGSRLLLDGQVLIDHDGLHGAEVRDAEVTLKAGYHPLKIEFFQSGGGKMIGLKWKSFNDTEFKKINFDNLFHRTEDRPEVANLPMTADLKLPGDGFALETVHPSFDLATARTETFLPKVGGMDFMSDGTLVVSTWEPAGSVYLVKGTETGDPNQISIKEIASGLAEPLGLKVVEDTIYVLQKQELTKLIDTNGDEYIDEYQTVCNGWRVSANFHEFAFGLAHKDDHFYATLAIAILPGGASAQPQIPDRGKVVKINRFTGKHSFVAQGLRTPNGIGIGVDNELFVADNQGDWLPSCKILHVTEGAFFGSHATDPEGTKNLTEKPPVVWLPQDEIGNSPSTPLAINVGPFKGQMIHGEVTHGGVKRVFVEKINGEYQGALFRFIQGLEAGVNRMAWSPNGALYVGGIGSTGNWQQYGKHWYGLQSLAYNGKPTFEMLAVRSKANGMEIEFTEPLPEGTGWNPSDYSLKQWYYLPTENYGGPKMDETSLTANSASVSADRKRVFLEIDGLKAGHVVYLKLPNDWISAAGRELWSTECWYTLNQLATELGTVNPSVVTVPPNTLSDEEKAQGWQLLFDGTTTKGWRNYGKPTLGSDWHVQDGALHLAVNKKDDNWQSKNGGDIITDQPYENFELRLEWKIGACGNSGIIYHVKEDTAFDYCWMTGPEMQILDNSCHPDAKIKTHRAGDLYDFITTKYPTVKPAGNWNAIRLISKNGKVEHWLNGRQVVTMDMSGDEWKTAIANSKFKDWEGFGKQTKGHIALQDHGDPVWFRNIKIRTLE